MQKNKTTRVPGSDSWEEVKAVMPPSNNPNSGPNGSRRPTRVIWNVVCSGYQPELATAWSRYGGQGTGGASNNSSSNNRLEPVFLTSVFWVVTRSLNCPYCMGHTEMIMERNGLTKPEVAERARLLAGEDWSSFPAEEQRAFAFAARKLSPAPPGRISAADIESLKCRDFGPERGARHQSRPPATITT